MRLDADVEFETRGDLFVVDIGDISEKP